MNELLYDSLPLVLPNVESYSWADLIRACTDPVCLTFTFADMVWILFKQEKSAVMATGIDPENTRDPENVIPNIHEY